MFCNQCEQVFQGSGCVDVGVCGKDEDVQSLQELLLYGVKGLAAYAHHARRLGKVDEAVDAFVEEALFATVTNVNFDIATMLELVLECGKQNLRVMELLDEGHVEQFGPPSPTQVYEGTRNGPGILVTGHDLLDLKLLLEQTAGTGVNVYTHGEMLPAHMYPELRKYPHLVGNYGGAWQNQRREFADFSGPVLATTNCILIPPETYRDRLFTSRMVAVPGGRRILDNDYAELIACAKQCAPLVDDQVTVSTIGFHHSVITGIAPQILDAVKAGKLRHFYLVGGCDGAEPSRRHFTEFAARTPADTLVLTLGCGKFRIRDEHFGTLDVPGVGPIPRLLDMGQCNDAYGAIRVAAALAEALGCGVNDLPLTIALSWFEQKAVAVLLTLLHLGVKGIRIGPKPPAFVSPNVFKLLQEQYDLGLFTGDDNVEARGALAGV